MTIEEVVQSVIFSDTPFDEMTDEEKLIYFAYWYGKETEAREYGDKVREFLFLLQNRANACRYHRMVKHMIGDKKYIYSSNYAGNITNTFGKDEVTWRK